MLFPGVFGLLSRCTPGRRLRAAARLRVTHITNRRQVGVFDSDKNKESGLMAEHQRMLREKLGLRDSDFQRNTRVGGGVVMNKGENGTPLSSSCPLIHSFERLTLVLL